ncbi:MAG: Rossmann-like and DUF2520 domain-containing protein [Bacteroidales bacterium]
MKHRVVILGSGNVATHLVAALAKYVDIVQIYSQTVANAQKLADLIGCSNYSNQIGDIVADADIYLFIVKDDAIAMLANQIKVDNPTALFIHTSGSVSADVFANVSSNYGVLYPLQTFTKGVDVNFAEISIFTQGNKPESKLIVDKLASYLTTKVYTADSELRRKLHIAAVFACNFANHMWDIADGIMQREELPFDVLLPLIQSSIDKIKRITPHDAQTGPAVRGDKEITNKHISMLTGAESEIYKLISENIYNERN